MISSLRDIRTQLLLVVAVLIVIDLAAIGFLLSPAGRSRSARQQEFEQLRVKKLEQQIAAQPIQGMEQKIATARDQEAAFNAERLPQRYSAMSELIARLAKESGVNISDIKYDPSVNAKGIPAGYGSIGISIQIRGGYEPNLRFINAIERQKTMFLIDGVTFGGAAKDSNQLLVSIHLSTFLRSAA